MYVLTKEVYLIGKSSFVLRKDTKKEKEARGISRVLYFSRRHCASALTRSEKPLPFIQPGGCPPDRQQPTPRLGRAVLRKHTPEDASRHRCTWSCNPQAVRLSTSPTTPVGSYPTFSPLPSLCSRKKTAVVLCYGCTSSRPSGTFTSAAPYVARTFLPSRFTDPKAASKAAAEPPCFYDINICTFKLHILFIGYGQELPLFEKSGTKNF